MVVSVKKKGTMYCAGVKNITHTEFLSVHEFTLFLAMEFNCSWSGRPKRNGQKTADT